MNEEEKTITTNEPAAEKQTKPAKPKRTDEEKLQECYEKRDRLREQKTAHKNKGQVIDKSIAENNAKIAELENYYPAFYLVLNHTAFNQIKKRHSINYSDGFYIGLLYAVPLVLS